MNWLSWEVAKNSLIADITGRMLISVWGAMASTSWVFMRSRTTRSMRDRPVRSAFWISSPTLRMRRFAKWSWSSMWYVVSLAVRSRARLSRYVAVASTSALESTCRSAFGTLEQVAEELDVLRDLVAELAVELVAADAAEVVALLGEEGALEVLTSRFDGLHFAGTGAAVDLEPGGLLAGAQEVLGRVVDVELLHVLGDLEVRLLPVQRGTGPRGSRSARRTSRRTPRPSTVSSARSKREDRDATLARDARAGVGRLVLLLFEVDLEPLAAARVDGAFEGDLLVLAGLEEHAGRTHELGDHDALGAVDDEGPLLGHDREVAHEDGLLFDLAGLGVKKARAHEDGLGVRRGALAALFDGELRRTLEVRVVGVELELERETPGEVGDRARSPRRPRASPCFMNRSKLSRWISRRLGRG